MTTLKTPVRRSVASGTRDLVIMLTPTAEGGLVSVKEKGRREWYSIGLGSLYLVLVERAVATRSLVAGRARRTRVRRGSSLLKVGAR